MKNYAKMRSGRSAARKSKRKKSVRLREASPIILQTPATATPGSSASRKLLEVEVDGKKYEVDPTMPLKLMSADDYVKTYSETKIKPKQTIFQNDKVKGLISKLPEAKFREVQDHKVRPATPPPNNYIRFMEKTPEELDAQVEYCVDEDDIMWLEMMNEMREASQLPPIDMDMMELLMDRLEKECYFLVQRNRDQDNASSVEDEAVCSVCLDGEAENSNAILFCDMCNLAVHQDCYGVPYIPEGQWLCRRCMHSPSAPVDCILCPNNGGAFKQTDHGYWAHVVCALWIPEVRFANTVFLEPIDSIGSIPAARWRLTCSICKLRNVGACIQCHKTNCYSAFHVTCAQQAGLYMNMETTHDSGLGQVMVQKIAYCDAHAPTDGRRKHCLGASSQSESSDDETGNTKRKVQAKKRSSAPVISVPTIPPEKVQEIASKINIPKKAAFIQRLIAYWTLKRHLRNGVPLLRRLITSHSARRNEFRKNQGSVVLDESESVKISRLRQDLERGRLLCELVRKRERVKREFYRIKEQLTLAALTPFNTLLKNIIEQLETKDTCGIFLEPVDTTEVPDYASIVKQPMDLKTMKEKAVAFKYESLEALEADFNLMITNCITYNSKDTIYYRAALRLRDQAGYILRQARKQMMQTPFDKKSGFFEDRAFIADVLGTKNKKVYSLSPCGKVDERLEKLNNGLETTDPDEMLKQLQELLQVVKNEIRNKTGRMRREWLIRRRIMQLERMRHDKNDASLEMKKPAITQSDLKKGEVSQTPVKLGKIEGTGDAMRNAEIMSQVFRKKKSILTQNKGGIPDLRSFQVYRQHEDNEVKSDDNSSSDSDDEESSSSDNWSSCTTDNDEEQNTAEAVPQDKTLGPQLPASGSEEGIRDKDEPMEAENCEDASTSDGHSALKQLQPVWAKRQGVPWYPALIINPEMPAGYEHNGVSVPSPPEEILKIGSTYTEPMFLVLMFDKKRSWKWLSRSQLEPLGMNDDFDQKKIMEVKKTTYRKAIRKAYEEALNYKCDD